MVTAVIEGRSVKFWLKSAENLQNFAQIVYNFNLGLLFVISIKLPPYTKFQANQNKEVMLFYFFTQAEPKIQDDVIKTS